MSDGQEFMPHQARQERHRPDPHSLAGVSERARKLLKDPEILKRILDLAGRLRFIEPVAKKLAGTAEDGRALQLANFVVSVQDVTHAEPHAVINALYKAVAQASEGKKNPRKKRVPTFSQEFFEPVANALRGIKFSSFKDAQPAPGSAPIPPTMRMNADDLLKSELGGRIWHLLDSFGFKKNVPEDQALCEVAAFIVHMRGFYVMLPETTVAALEKIAQDLKPGEKMRVGGNLARKVSAVVSEKSRKMLAEGQTGIKIE